MRIKAAFLVAGFALEHHSDTISGKPGCPKRLVFVVNETTLKAKK